MVGMKTMMKGTLRILAATAVLALGVNTAEAAKTPADTHEIRVINNHAVSVQVYLEDADGHLHDLGRVDDSEFRVLEIDAAIATLGDFRLKIYPEAPPGSLTDRTTGIRSVDLRLGDGDAVNVHLGRELTRSQIEVTRG